ncbi:NAD+ synthase [Solimonas marina]|uniref:Glutamine-dependent NAD(+) synthetase n=1 Tax=Solimonas marina TaxID=2714601 RepID=A0A969W8F0_9GAMM|nr:NAD+ synthase [Solimonas marina]NKF21393.1 NAD+ synthase [Solimonas marina]
MAHARKPLKLALAQLNLWVGDVEGNVQKIIDAAAHARDTLGAELIATPELSLIGYPPDDLLLRSAMPGVIEDGVQRLLAEVRGITLIVGLPEYADGKAGGTIYNAAYVIRDGRVIARTRKQLLPNYGVFDERRHFRAGHQTLVFEQSGVQIGLCICEDIWGPGPAAAAKGAGAELLVNINASPFDTGKSAGRRRVFDSRVAETGLPIAYVNSVGGQDDVLFDGDSAAVDGDGRIAFEAPLFDEGVFALSFDNGRWQGEALRAPMPIEAIVYRGLVQSVRDYVNRNGFPGAVLGLSGGIDSALVAAVAADALGADRVWGVSLPSRYTAGMSNDDARLEAEALGIRYSVLPIEPAFEAFSATLAETFGDRPPDLTEENIQSRSRGVLLMALSNKFGSVVLTTGNKSEMAVGYSTLYGDMCGGFAPIKDVYKTLVYQLAVYRNSIAPAGKPVIPERVITRPPSAELRHEQKDSDSLPPYEVLDPLLELYVENQLSIAEIVARGFDEATVRRVAMLVRRSEYKRRQAPPGPKVTSRAFGRERRYPLTAVYGDI